MAESNAERKARGAFFTPPAITRFIADWAVRSAEDSVLEPSCGDAEFLLAAGARLRELGSGLFTQSNLHGVELHAPSGDAARRRLSDDGLDAQVTIGNFFDYDACKRFDAVIGNPPYVRYQDFAGDSRVKALEAALRQGVRLSGLASSWAAFVIHSASLVREGGRLGLVLPAELLSVKYAAEVRRFLLNRFATIRLVMFEELVFPDVQEEVVLLLAEGEGPAPFFEVFQARNLTDLVRINRTDWVPFAPDDDDKWLRALLPTTALATFRSAHAPNYFDTLGDWGTIYLGTVTGNNRYFALSIDEARELGFDNSELLRISPPGSKHLRGLTFTASAWEEMARSGRKVFLFTPKADDLSEAARRYIEAGVTTGVNRAYKCKSRSPWWGVPLVAVPDLFLTYMDQHRPRLVTNHAGVRILNSLYGVKLLEERRKTGVNLLPLASLNSLTLLGAELVGRAYGGGMLKLEPREADQLPMPSPQMLAECANPLAAVRPQLNLALRQGDIDGATKLIDRILLVSYMGLDYDEILALRDARKLLFGRRVARAGRGNGTD